MQQRAEYVSYKGLPFRQRLRGNRRLIDYTKVQALIGTLIRSRWTGGTARSEYLNVGCGPNIEPGFVNLDYHWRPGVDVCWDLARPLPFKQGSLRGIYTEHCLEHVPLETCNRVLCEFYAMLRPGGTLRVVVPDAELCMRTYLSIREGQTVSFPDLQAPPPDWTPVEEVNRIFRDHGHQYAYDFEMLKKMLLKAGFSSVVKASYRAGLDEHLLIDSEKRRGESLYVDAVR